VCRVRQQLGDFVVVIASWQCGKIADHETAIPWRCSVSIYPKYIRAVRIPLLLVEYSTEYLIKYSSSQLTQEVATGINCRVVQNKPVKIKHGTVAMITSTSGITPDPQLRR